MTTPGRWFRVRLKNREWSAPLTSEQLSELMRSGKVSVDDSLKELSAEEVREILKERLAL